MQFENKASYDEVNEEISPTQNDNIIFEEEPQEEEE